MRTTNARRRQAGRALATALAALALAPASLAAQRAPARVSNIRQLAVVAAAPGQRLEIVLDRAALSTAKREAPDRLAIELDNTRPGDGIHGSLFEVGLVAEIRLFAVGVPSRPRTRLAIRTRAAADYRLRVDGSRIVVDLVPEGFEPAPATAAPAAPVHRLPAPAAAPAPAPAPVAAAAEPAAVTPPRREVEAGIEEEDLPAERADAPPFEEPAPRELPSLAPAEVPGLDAGAAAAALAAIAPEPAESAPPRLRELYSVAPEAVPALAVAAPAQPLDELAPEASAGGEPRLRVTIPVVAEPVPALALPPLAAAPAEIAPAPGTRPAPPKLRVEPSEESASASQLAPLEPLAAAVEPAPAMPSESLPMPSPPAAAAPSEAAATVLPDEVVQADELVPPAEIARPAAPPAAPPGAAPGPATRIFGVERLERGAVRIAADGVLAYLSFRLENPERFVLELDGVVNESPLDSLPVDEPLLLRVRIGQYRRAPRPVTRVVFDLRTPSIPEIESTPSGLVVRFVRAVPRMAARERAPDQLGAGSPPTRLAPATSRSFSTLRSRLIRASSRSAALQLATSIDQTRATGRRASV